MDFQNAFYRSRPALWELVLDVLGLVQPVFSCIDVRIAPAWGVSGIEQPGGQVNDEE